MYAKPSLLVLRAFMPLRRLGRSQMTMKLKRRDTIPCNKNAHQDQHISGVSHLPTGQEPNPRKKNTEDASSTYCCCYFFCEARSTRLDRPATRYAFPTIKRAPWRQGEKERDRVFLGDTADRCQTVGATPASPTKNFKDDCQCRLCTYTRGLGRYREGLV